MKDIFKDILDLNDVHGVVLFSLDGKVLFKEFLVPLPEEPERRDWWGVFFHALKGVREADVIFEGARLYIRKTAAGFLMVLTGRSAPTAMLRLHCDILLPLLKESPSSRGLSRLFKRGVPTGGR